MLKSLAKKVAWMARTTTTVVGLAIMLALVVGVASVALGADGQALLLGKNNAATTLTKLTGNVDGSAMQVQNNNPGTNDSALSLTVERGETPMKVNSTTKVVNLNSDRVDGKNATDLVPGGTVPVGTTIRGNYEIDGYASAAGQLVGGDSISFGYALASNPASVIIDAGESSTPDCPGTATFPQARPGYLCVYEGAYINNDSGSPLIYNVTRVGAGVYMYSGSAGSSYSSGTWAVTAPGPAQAARLPSQHPDDPIARRQQP